ncbi:MAG: NADH-quinone oxidoreductase subunit J [Sulfurospirillaceae bacterium]|nr:NADH-quinone oxidoreductase subunit J [Sulfurospirillaceae bacterium]
MADIVFAILAIFALVGAFGMVSFHSPIHSALSFIVTILALAGIFALLSAPFLFAVQIIVYAGAIMVLMLFIIMFLNVRESNFPKEPNKFISMFFGSILLLPVNIFIVRAFLKMPEKSMEIVEDGFGNIGSLSMELFTRWLLPFEAISILLLVALVGAVVLARKEES